MSTPLTLKLSNRMTVEQVLDRMNRNLVKNIFNAVSEAATERGWGSLNTVEDVFGKAVVEEETVPPDDGLIEEFMEHAHSGMEDN